MEAVDQVEPARPGRQPGQPAQVFHLAVVARVHELEVEGDPQRSDVRHLARREHGVFGVPVGRPTVRQDKHPPDPARHGGAHDPTARPATTARRHTARSGAQRASMRAMMAASSRSRF